MTITTIIIKHPNLTSPMITVNVESTVELVQHDAGANRWYALLVDGRHYDLVMYKHTIGRPEAMEGLQQALSDVQAAITALQTPVTTLQFRKEIEYARATKDYVMFLNGELVGYARTPGDADKVLDQLVFELLNHPFATVAEVVEQHRDTLAESADIAAELLVCDECQATALDTDDGHVIVVAVDDEGSTADAWLCPGCWQRMIDLGEAAMDQHLADVAADIEASYAELDANPTTTTLAAPQPVILARMATPAVPVEVVPIAARAIPLAPGAHSLDIDALKDAYGQALRHPEMNTARWQNALNKAWTHLSDDNGIVSVGEGGAYLWWGEETSYAPTCATCQCKAFAKEQPCKHVAASRILSFLPVAEQSGVESEIEEAYRLIMWEVERMAA